MEASSTLSEARGAENLARWREEEEEEKHKDTLLAESTHFLCAACLFSPSVSLFFWLLPQTVALLCCVGAWEI